MKNGDGDLSPVEQRPKKITIGAGSQKEISN